MRGTSPSAHNRVLQPLVNKAGYPRQVTGNKYPKLREGKSSFFFFNFSFPTPNRHQVSVRPNIWQMELWGCPSRWQSFPGIALSPASALLPGTLLWESPALTVFIKKKFNYIRVIEKLPVTNAKTKVFFLFTSSLRRAGNASTEQSKWATNSLSTVLPSPQVPGDDPSLQGWQERDNSAIDLTRSA